MCISFRSAFHLDNSKNTVLLQNKPTAQQYLLRREDDEDWFVGLSFILSNLKF